MVVEIGRSGRSRLSTGLRVDLSKTAAVGIAEVEPGAARVDDVRGGGGWGGEGSLGRVNYETEWSVSHTAGAEPRR